MPADNHYCRRRGRTMMTGGVGGEGGREGGEDCFAESIVDERKGGVEESVGGANTCRIVLSLYCNRENKIAIREGGMELIGHDVYF